METNSSNQALAVSPNDKMASIKYKIDKLDLDREWLEKKIDIDKADLDKSINKINTSCPIKRNEYWISLFNSTDVDSTFTAIYGDFIALKNATVNAFQSSFFNSKETLKLLQKLAEYELDLYSIIDESELTSAELSSLFVDTLTDTNIKDETVLRLLQQAKDRALRLKERMDALRNEFNNNLGNNERRIKVLSEQFDKLTQDVHNKKIDTDNKYSHIEKKLSQTIEEHTNTIREIKNISRYKVMSYLSIAISIAAVLFAILK